MKAGARLGCPRCTLEVIVVRPPEQDVALACAGSPLGDLAELGTERPADGHEPTGGEGSLLGKRYVDDDAALELLCTKAGPGGLSCDGRPMTVKGAKPLPSSD